MDGAFALASSYVDEAVRMSSIVGTYLGLHDHDHEWGRLGVEGDDQRNELNQRYRRLLDPYLEDSDPQSRLAARVMAASLDDELASHAAGDHYRDLSHMASRLQRLRSVFDVMPKETDDDWSNITRRLSTIGKPIDEYTDLLAHGRDRGELVARRQVESVIAQVRRLASEGSALVSLGAAAPDRSRAAVAKALRVARSAYARLGDWLEREYLPHALDADGVGIDRYQRAANRFVGMELDILDTYQWGWDEFRRLLEELDETAELIAPGAGLLEVKETLETDPATTVEGPEDLVRFVSETLEEAADDLAGKHFDMPQTIRPLTVQIAPKGGPLGVYYVRPSEDLSRPGGVWYSIGDQQVFPTYQHVSTAYHEGFPGHHLQLATAIHNKDRLSRYQRLMTWCPGFGEGWAMYAEVLMGELGYLEDPRFRFGMLAKQMYRAARVVVDIGLHLGLDLDRESPVFPGELWDFDRAVEFMHRYGFRTPDQARDEVLRYLGWPGQAISYKLGEREILRIREETRQRMGPTFDLRSFHSTVLANGTMRLDLLRETVAEVM